MKVFCLNSFDPLNIFLVSNIYCLNMCLNILSRSFLHLCIKISIFYISKYASHVKQSYIWVFINSRLHASLWEIGFAKQKSKSSQVSNQFDERKKINLKKHDIVRQLEMVMIQLEYNPQHLSNQDHRGVTVAEVSALMLEWWFTDSF